MQTADTSGRQSPKGASHECCTDGPCDSGLRNQYFEGKRLTADSFRVEQSYLLERRRLLNRAIHGWGVVYGYALKPAAAGSGRPKNESGSVEIGPGLALDSCGRELLLAHAISLRPQDVMLFDRNGARISQPPEGSCKPHRETDDERPQACWLLSAHYAEQLVGPQKISDPCSCERREWEQVCETVRFSLRLVDCEDCCADFECELECGCGTGDCCRKEAGAWSQSENCAEEGDEPSATQVSTHGNPVRRGGCACLCEHLAGWGDAGDCRLVEIEDACARVRADLCHGVPLACVRLREGDCDNWLFDHRLEACGPRRLVKRNDMLFDLIRGCDLTRISAIGWAHWHRAKEAIAWDAFRKSFGSETPAESGRNVTSAYWVEFSRAVRKDTLRTDCFSMTVTVAEDEAGWGEARRVPIVDIETVDEPGQPGLVRRAKLVVDAGWVSDAIESRKKIFNQNETSVEIEIRGDYIVDCNGQTIDANAAGLSPAPTGNGTPGGSFLSIFRVQARDSRPQTAAPARASRTEGVES